MSAPTSILCLKCGAASTAAQAQCARCGGDNALVCSGCGFQNSIAKRYCDKCGEPAVEPAPAAGAASLALPLAGTRDPSLFADAPISGDPWAPTAPAPMPDAPEPRRWISLVRSSLNAAAAAAGVIISVLAVWYWTENRKPTVAVPITAARYLKALHSGDIASAYALFSEAAKKHCTLEEFKASRGVSAWTWSNLRIERIEENVILLAYELTSAGSPPREDHILFILENKRWVRPYNSVLMNKAEKALSAGDHGSALALAQDAAAVDQRDPLARGYLCEAAYYRKSPEETISQCEAAVNLARIYPSELTPKSLYRLQGILADTYKNVLGLPEQAIDHFSQMLAFPNISPADQCEILMARAEAYTTISRPGEALSDLERGIQLCARPEDQARLEDMRRKISAPPHQ